MAKKKKQNYNLILYELQQEAVRKAALTGNTSISNKELEKQAQEEYLAPIKRASIIERNTTNNNGISISSPSSKKSSSKKSTVTTTTKNENKSDSRSWFKSGAFSDGYQFGDLSKTIVGSATDVIEDINKGILGIGEGLVDTGAYLLGGGAKLIGKDDFSDSMSEFIKRDLVEESGIATIAANLSPIGQSNTLYNLLENKDVKKLKDSSIFETDSVLGEKSDSLIQSGGQLLGTAALQTVGVPWFVTTGVTSFGGGTEQAFNEDATYGEAGGYGLISAGAEVLTEKLSGGISFGGKTLDDALLKPLTNKISSKTLKALTNFGLDVAGEGSEEVVSEVIQNIGKKLTYEDEKTWNDLLTSEEAMDSYLESFIGGSVLGGVGSVSQSISKKANNNTDIVPNQAQIEGLQQEIARETEELNKTQDAREKQIREEKIDGLYQELKEVINAQQITDESELRKQNFVYEAQETDSDIKKAVYESASQVMNNTQKSHKFVDVVAKIAEEKGTIYKFTNNEQLKQLGYSKDNVTINGLVNENGEVLINIDSAKALNTILGHETTHLLEGTKEYDALKQVAIEYAKSKGDYDARVERLTKLYEGTDADIEAELTSDIVGEYLFTDENFVKELSVKQPTLFEKIKNFISDLVVKFKGTEQEKQLRQLQRSFEKAYKAQGTETSNTTKYSFLGEEMLRDNSDAMEMLEEAKRLDAQGVDKNYIRQNTGWFKSEDHNWKAEVDDSKSRVVKKLEPNKTYYLGDILDHKQLYALNDNYKNIQVMTRDLKSNGAYGREKGKIVLNNKIINDTEQVRSTLLHEIQHATQHAEGWQGGTNLKKAGSWEAYQNNYGEREAKEVQARRNMSFEERTKIAPSTQSKIQYSISESTTDLDNLLKDNNLSLRKNGSLEYKNLNEKQINQLVKIYQKNGYSDVSADYLKESINRGSAFIPREVTDEFIKKVLKYTPNYDTTQIYEDAEGNPLTKEQVEFYKDSDVRDVRGRLIPVYHKTNADFNVFDSNSGKQHGNKYGKGFYFSITPENYGNREIKAYLNAKEGEYKYIPSKGYYVVQNNNAIKLTTNTKPTSNPDIRYSLSEDGKMVDNKGNEVKLEVAETGTHGTLMAIHNLSDFKLKGILELGGFPVPSIAITDTKKVDFTDYGDVSVLFNKETINPTNKLNEVYASDVYSPRFPQTVNELNDAGVKQVAKILGMSDYEFESNYEHMTIDDVVNRLTREEHVIDKYLESKNITVDPIYKTYSAEQSRVPVKYIENFFNAHQELQDSDINIREIDYNKYSDEIKQICIDSLVEQGVSVEDAQDLYNDFGKADVTKFLIDVKNYKKTIGQGQQIDNYATKRAKEQHIDFYSDEYISFVENLIAPAFGDKYIRNGKDLFTPSGNRRSFKQLYDAYNLENVVKNMKGKVRGEEGFFYGAGNIRSQVTPQFKSIAEIKAREGKIVTESQMEEVKQDINSDLNNLSVTARNFGGYSYDSYEAALNEIAELKRITSEKARNILSEYGFKDVPDILVNKSIEFLEKLKNAPTAYFEAKPQRAVGFDEVEAIVIRNDMSAELKQQLYDKGLNVIEYDPNIEGDRQAKINELDDLKFSLSQQGEEIAPTGNWNVRGEDVKLQVEEAIAPLQETIANLTEQIQTIQENIVPEVAPIQEVKPTRPTLEEVQNLMDIQKNQSGSDYARAFFALRDKYGQPNLYKSLNEYNKTGTVTEDTTEDYAAPVSQEVVEQQNAEAFKNITDNQAPSFEDIADEAMWSEDFESTNTEHIPSPLDSRDIEEVGNRKVKAYQYENPEVKPYFQQEAEAMLGDLDNTIKGERIVIKDQDGYITDWAGIERQTTEAIAYLKDNYGYTYDQIRKGLNAIIEDDGKENNAVSKRIEFMLDERLREGYTTSDGFPIPPNEEYINFLNEKQITQYNKEAFNALTDDDVPVETTDIEKSPLRIAPKQRESATNQNLKVSEQLIPTAEKVAQNQNTKLSDTSTETQDKEKIAKILSERPTQENKKQRLWAKFRAGILDKGSVFEDLAIKENNRELMGKWDYILTSESRAQNAMLNGTYEYDSTFKQRTKVSKSLDEIRTEVGDNVQKFSEYLYHKHNINRMSLESDAQSQMAELKETTLKDFAVEGIEKLATRRVTEKTDAKIAELIEAAKEYVALSEVKNKPVFGDSITAEVSKEIVDKYEMNNPEFMNWAKDVYDYNKANLNQLVKNGVITQETADLFGEMYPNYVPIGRANVDSVAIDTNRTGINAPIKRATGGNSDILPLFDTMAKRTIQTYKAIAKNNFGVELKNTLNSSTDNQQTNVDEILDSVDQQGDLLQEGKNGKAPTFTVFENGEKITYDITQDMYEALKPLDEGSLLTTTVKPLQAVGGFQRGVLTEYNPVFMLTNAIKDTQDILLNSQHSAKTYSKLPEATAQILKKGYWYQEYLANGGEQNSYFDNQDGTFGKESFADKILPLKAISKVNNMIEMSPRLAEYIASREAGRSVETSMLDAARVTTNFKAGGDITKWANRNGATFLNASVQGAMQQVRNVREAHANGLKGYANLATKFAIAGVPALLLNGLLWGDDEEYEELSDYVKTNYWIIGKYGDGNFIRIPKGRMITVVQESFNQMKHLITGDEQADLGKFLEVMGNNIAPNNPIENNVLSPIIQAATNKTWYGGDLVPTRLQDVPAEEQYDESIDKLSIAIGQATGISPYKINYVLDQYSGGIGDVLLPMMTQQAEGGNDSLASNLLAPLTDKFSVDSVMKNQNVSDLYSLSEDLTVNANSSKASDEDVLKNKYLNAVKAEMNELYKQKREVQNSDLSDSEKYEQVREIQKQINSMAKEATENYEDVTVKSDYSEVAGKEYYKNNDGEWTKVKDEEAAELSELGMTVENKNTYFKTKNAISEIVKDTKGSKEQITLDEDSEEYKEAIENLSDDKKTKIIDNMLSANLSDEQKAYLYGKYYSSDKTLDKVIDSGISFSDYLTYSKDSLALETTEDKAKYLYESNLSDKAKTVIYETSVLSGFDNEDKYKDYKTVKAAGVDINSWLSYKKQEFKADKDSDGDSISGSRKRKIVNYINSLELNIPQKAMLIRTEYESFDDYNNDIVSYVNSLDLTLDSKAALLENIGMTVDANGNVSW